MVETTKDVKNKKAKALRSKHIEVSEVGNAKSKKVGSDAGTFGDPRNVRQLGS